MRWSGWSANGWVMEALRPCAALRAGAFAVPRAASRRARCMRRVMCVLVRGMLCAVPCLVAVMVLCKKGARHGNCAHCQSA